MKKTFTIRKRISGVLMGLLFTGAIYAAPMQYTLTDADVVVTNGVIISCSYDFGIKSIIIPSTLDGQTVIGIEDENSFAPDNFMGRGITAVALPSTLKTIGAWAFRSNDLTSVIIPDGVTFIGDVSFSNNDFNFTTISIPNSVTYIGSSAFTNNGINSITLPTPSISGFQYWIDGSGVNHNGGEIINSYSGESYRAKIVYTLTDNDVVVDADGIILSCSYDFANGYKDLIIPSTLDGQTVLGIFNSTYSGVFKNKGLLSVSLPSTIKSIGGYAFSSNSLTSLDIPASVVTIGDNAFNGNDLTELVLPADVDYIGLSAFGFNNLDNVTLPNSVTFIGGMAFYGNNFTNLVLPTPPNNKFQIWVGTDKVDYSVGETVKVNTGAGFTAKIYHTLTDVEVTVTNGVIMDCSYDYKSKYIVIPSILDGQTVVGIPNGTIQNGGKVTAVFSKKGIVEVTLPSTLTSIGDFAFYENSLTTLTIPSNVSYIGIQSFMLNNDLVSSPVFPSPEKADYTFTNWKSSTGTVYAAGATVPNSFDISFTAQFTPNGGTSLNELSGKTDILRTFPNPFHESFSIEANDLYEIQIINALGSIVYTRKMDALNQVVDLSNLADGVYLMIATNNAGVSYSKKIIKN